MLYLDETPISEIPLTEPPTVVKEAFESARKVRGLDHIKLHYISSEIAKSYCPSLVIVGEMGYADYDTNTCYVVESDRGEGISTRVALHELRHFVDGPHPWPEERKIAE